MALKIFNIQIDKSHELSRNLNQITIPDHGESTDRELERGKVLQG